MSDAQDELSVGPEDALSIPEAAVLGLQHVLSMNVYVMPLIIASGLALTVPDSAALIAAAFIAAGVGTLIQSQLCMRIPIVHGPSFVPIGAILAIAFASGGGIAGLSVVFGALPGAILIILLGWPKGIYHRIVGTLVPPLVGGAIIIVVGVALMPVALRESVFALHGTGTIGQNIALAATAAAILVLCAVLGMKTGVQGRWVRLSSFIIAISGGCILAAMMGRFSMQAIAEAPWFSLPRIAFVNFEVTFSLSPIITMIIIYLVVLAETTGSWFAIGAVTDRQITDQQLNRGAMGQGFSCLASALLGSTPMTGYSSSAGVIAMTGIASRVAFLAAGILLVLFGVVGKLSAVIASIPAPVTGGVFGVLCAIIAMNGFRIIRTQPLDERNMLVVGLPILLALFATLAPPDWVTTLPETVQYLIGSSIAFGAIAAMLLNIVLPANEGSAARTSVQPTEPDAGAPGIAPGAAQKPVM